MESIIHSIHFLRKNNLRNRRLRQNLRNSENDILDMNDITFVENFRLNKCAFEYVLNEIETAITSNKRSTNLTTKRKLAACLRFFAQGNYQLNVGNDMNISVAQSTFSQVLSEMLPILETTLCSKWIKLNMDEDEKNKANLYFFKKYKIPGIIMCVDGTHIKILKPSSNEHLYYYSKDFYSLNALVICDHEQKIRFIDARYQGGNHDSHIWAMSDAKKMFVQKYENGDVNSRLLGDSDYPLQPWLITPFKNTAAESPECRFNRAHSKARNIVEQTIALLKARFQCLIEARSLHYKPEKVVQIVNVCAALHNICLYFKVPTNLDVVAINNNIENHSDDDDSSFDSEEGNEIRRQMLNAFVYKN